MNKFRLFLLAIFSVACSTVFAQNTNWRISDSGGENGNTFQIDCTHATSEAATTTYIYDSGLTGNYSANESYTRDIASTNSGAISIKFTQFNLASGTTLTIKDAISQAVLVSNATGTTLNGRTFSSNRGALELIWSSGSTTGAGFCAKIWCGSMCQVFTTTITPSLSATTEGTETYYDVCDGTAVNFTASSVFPQNNTDYAQSEATLFYRWGVVDENEDTVWNANAPGTQGMQNFSRTFTERGGYIVVCEASDDRNCMNRNVNAKKVRVSIPPTWEDVTFGPDTICPGTQVTFTGEPSVVPWSKPIPDRIAGTTFLPDGNSTCYSTSLVFDIFADGASITSINDIDHVYLNMEHSYFGDLSIVIQCPNGNQCLIHGYSGGSTMSSLNWTNHGGVHLSGSSGGGSFHLGLAPDPWSGDDCYYTAGEGYSYNIYPNGTVPFGQGSPTTSISYTDPCGDTQTSSVVQENQNYGPYENMTSLIGCPLNGIWTIYVCDHLSSDNGYIFEWGLYFNDDLYPTDLWTFTNTYQTSTYSWSGENLTDGQNGNTTAHANVQNSDTQNAALIPYTFTATDNFGCAYDTTVTVYVLSSRDPSCCIEPSPIVTASSTTPCGNSITLSAGSFALPSNTGQWTYTGPGTATFSAENAPQTNVTVNVYGDYTFTWHEYYQGNANCTGEASVNVNFAMPMDATLDPISSCCRSGEMILINAQDFGTLSVSPSSAALNVEARTFTPSLATPGTYTITNRIDGERCASPATSTQSFTIYDEVSVSNRQEECGTGADPMVTVSFNVNGVSSATPPTYSITGTYTEYEDNAAQSHDGTISVSSSTATSYSFQGHSALEYALVVEDAHGCGSVSVPGYYACDCPNFAGTFASNAPVILCTGDTYTIAHNGDQEVDVSGGVFSYIICSDPLDVQGSHICTLQGSTTTIGLGTITGGNYNTQYYLVAVAGYGAGLAAWGNGCRSLSQAVPLMWKQTPTPTVTGGETCGLVITLNGSSLPSGMSGYWTATGPEGVGNYSYTTINNTTNTQPNATVLSSHYGIATYTWNVVNAECTGHASATYNFRQVPSPEAGPDMTVCGVNAEISGAHATYPIINGSTLLWSGAGVVMTPATTIQPTANANGSGTYTITLTERNGECVGTDNVNITFISVPSPATTANVDTICGHVAELQVYNTNPANEGRWTAYDMNHNIIPVSSYHAYGNPSLPSSDRYPHCFVSVPIPDEVTEIEYEFVWSEPINDPRLPDDAECFGEASKHIVFRKMPSVSVHQCGSTGDHISVCGTEVELCAEVAASQGYTDFAWITKDINGHYADSLSPETTFTLDSTVTITRFRDVQLYFVAKNHDCMIIDTLTVRFLQRPVADAGRDHVACGRDYVLNGAWSLLPDTTYTPVCQWTTLTKPEGALNPTWTNTPHDSITEPVHVNDYGVYTFQLRETNTAGEASNCYSLDTVTVEFMEQPVVNAGPDFDVCGLDFTMHAVSSHIEGDSITGSWMCMDGGNATFVDRTDPEAQGHFSAYGPAVFRWVETNHPHIEVEDATETCAAWDEVTVTFYEIPSAAINMNAGDTVTCGLTFEFLRADATGSDIQGFWYEQNPSTQFGPQNSTVNSTVSDVTVSSYGAHDFYWIEYNGPEDRPRFCQDTAGPWTVQFMQQPTAEIRDSAMLFCSNNGQLHVDFNGIGVGRWSSSVASNVVWFDDRDNPNTAIHTNILNSDNPSYPYYTLYWAVQNTEYCTAEDSIRVVFARVPSDSIKVIPPKCFGEAAVLTAYEDSLSRYDWSYGVGIIDTVINNAQNGEYRTYIHWEDKEATHIVGLTTTNSWGCQSNIGQAIVEEPQLPEYSYNIIMDTCSLGRGGIEFLDTTGFFAFFWIDTTVGPTITNPNTGYAITDFHVYNIPQGRYTYRSDYQSFNREYFTQYYSYFGDVYCHDFPEVEVGTIGMIEAEFAVSADVILADLVAPEANVIFVNSTNYDNVGKRCEWHFGDGVVEKNCDELVEHVYTEPGCYEPYLVVMNRDLPECRDTAFLDECVFVDKESKLEIPNIFSPNGDGVNDFFQVNAQTLKTFHGTILNRYGRVVFEWTDWENEDAGWDGRLNGTTKATPGIYYYIIEAEGYDNHIYKEEGALHLVR